MVLGTVSYMSPEQARGFPVDKRADIWAFGCVLFEMLTGTRAFRGTTMSDIVASILEHEPNWSLLPPTLPAGVVRVVRRALVKDPQRRLRDLGDARLELESPAADPPAAAAPVAPAVARSRGGRIVALLAMLVLGVIAGGGIIALAATATRRVSAADVPLRHSRRTAGSAAAQCGHFAGWAVCRLSCGPVRP